MVQLLLGYLWCHVSVPIGQVIRLTNRQRCVTSQIAILSSVSRASITNIYSSVLPNSISLRIFHSDFFFLNISIFLNFIPFPTFRKYFNISMMLKKKYVRTFFLQYFNISKIFQCPKNFYEESFHRLFY